MKTSTAALAALILSGCVSANSPSGAVTAAAAASPLAGKTYIIELAHSAGASGYEEQLIPAVARALSRSPMRPKNGPGADVVVNFVPSADVGQWRETARGRQWVYSMKMMVGISPEAYSIPYEGTPKFGVTATMKTLDSDRISEMNCLVDLAVAKAVSDYRPTGMLTIDGQSCNRDGL